MREILFRGKRTDNGEWVYGNLVRGCDEKYAYIVEFGNKELCRNYINVKPDTIGQYTGLKDKNDTKIFEGDIVKYNDNSPCKIEYIDCQFAMMWKKIYRDFEDVYDHDIEVIGNIYDNKEILDVK